MPWIAAGYAIRTVLRICGVPRSTYYYRLKHPLTKHASKGGRPIPGYSWNNRSEKVPDGRIKGYIRNLLAREEESTYGYRKLTKCLRRRYGLCINKKKVYRLCKALGVLKPQREITNRVPRKLANNREVTGPNQLWQMDIKYGYVTGKRRHFYLASIIDVFDRCIVAYHRGKACDTQDIKRIVHHGLLKRGVFEADQRLVIRTDNGPQFISNAFHVYSEEMGFEHERTPNKTPNKNAYIESFHSILERDCYQRNSFETYEHAFTAVDRFIRFYNERRMHGSLHDLAPAEYLRQYELGLLEPQKIAL